MTRIILILLAILICFQSTAQPLTRIYENGKYGYIDSNGRVVIAPAFPSAGEFNEGVAPARTGGLYGYIDTTGKYIIQPQFDYAEPFYKGFAIAYRHGLATYIDKKGNMLFKPRYCKLKRLYNSVAIASTSDTTQVLINKYGKPVNEYEYSNITSDTNFEAAVVHDAIDFNKVGVINRKGEFIIPYSRYDKISDFSRGYALVRNEKNELREYGIINTKGKLQYWIKEHPDTLLENYSNNNGYIEVRMRIHWNKISTSKDWIFGYRYPNGKIGVSNSPCVNIRQHHTNRQFCRTAIEQKRFILIDSNDKQVGSDVYQETPWCFINGKALVRLDNAYYFIDTNGKKLSASLPYVFIAPDGINNGCFYYKDTNTYQSGLYGIADENGKRITKPILASHFPYQGFVKGLVMGMLENNKICYINRKGIMVWHEDTNAIAPHVLDIDYMNSTGYNVRDYLGYDYPGRDTEQPQIITAANSFPANKLSLIVHTKDTTDFGDVKSFVTHIVNNTNSDMHFNWNNNVQEMVLQALDNNGEWRNIECRDVGFCGNISYGLKLEAGMYWTVYAPIYTGIFKTRLRAKLTYVDPNNKKEALSIYSNSFEGSINPAQFWRKSSYNYRYPLNPNND